VKLQYIDQGQDYCDKQYREPVTKNLQQRAACLGFDLMPSKKDEAAPDTLLSMT